jgi:hypothetical protein
MKIRFTLTLIVLLLALVGLASPALAGSTVTFSDVNFVDAQIAVYEVNETGAHLLGVYNSTDNSVVFPDSALIVFKPAPVDYLKNPEKIPDLLLAMAGPWASLLALLVVAIVGLVILRGRR